MVTENKDVKPVKDDFENQIFERFGSEPSRRDKSKNEIQKPEDVANGTVKQNNTNTSKSENNKEIPVESENTDSFEDHNGHGEKSENNEMKTLMILDEFPSIVGVDKNVYGPVSPQDLITIPEPNARILVKNKKGILIQTYK